MQRGNLGVASALVVLLQRRNHRAQRASAAPLSDGGSPNSGGKAASKSVNWDESTFIEMDSDKSGGIDQLELRKALAARGLVVESGFLEGLWEVLDTDGSGVLEQAEFVRAMGIIEGKRAEGDGTVRGVHDKPPQPAPEPEPEPKPEPKRPSGGFGSGSAGAKVAPPDLSLLSAAPKLAPPPSLDALQTPTRAPPSLEGVPDPVRPAPVARPVPPRPTPRPGTKAI